MNNDNNENIDFQLWQEWHKTDSDNKYDLYKLSLRANSYHEKKKVNIYCVIKMVMAPWYISYRV